jgi:tetratricopeptide (TPR) repeat protein
VRLGRAYLALRYPAQATAQAEQALALDPESADARQLVEDAKGAPQRPVARTAAGPAAAASGNGGGAGGAARGATAAPNGASAGAATSGAAAAGARVYPFADPDPASAPAAMAPVAVAVAAAATPATGAAAPEPGAAPVEEAPAIFGEQRDLGGVKVGGTALEAQLAHLQAAPDPAGPTAAQRYRAALELLANREYEKATAELTQAIVLDPRLAVAYAARGSARFGLARYREAADDYRTSISIDENLATPLYGLAECYRVLGDGPKAAEMYQRYADSRAPDVREDLRTISAKRAQELRR